MTTLDRLGAKNIKTIWLLERDGGHGPEVVEVEATTPGALSFSIRRINGDELTWDVLRLVLTTDEYMQFAYRYSDEAQRAEAKARRPDAAKIFDDALERSETWEAKEKAALRAAQVAVLRAGMLDPNYEDAADALGHYGPALFTALRTWGRTVVTEPDLLNGNSVPP